MNGTNSSAKHYDMVVIGSGACHKAEKKRERPMEATLWDDTSCLRTDRVTVTRKGYMYQRAPTSVPV